MISFSHLQLQISIYPTTLWQFSCSQ